MYREISALFCCLSLLQACHSGGNLGSTESNLDDPMMRLPPEVIEELARYLSENDKRSFLSCEGFLTEVESEGYCSSEVPKGWMSFEYKDDTYYVHRLANQSNK